MSCLKDVNSFSPRPYIEAIPHKKAIVITLVVLEMFLMIGGALAAGMFFPSTGFSMLVIPCTGLTLLVLTGLLSYLWSR